MTNTMKISLMLAVLCVPSVAFAANAHPNWKILADCAAAYRANSLIVDPDRAPSMKAMISEQADDYAKQATRRYGSQVKSTKRHAREVVDRYIVGQVAGFGRKTRSDIEKIIEACPQE